MTKDQLISIVEGFSVATEPYLFVETSMTSDELFQFVKDQQLLSLADRSDRVNRVFRKDSVFLLWDEELMTLELFKSQSWLEQKLSERRAENLGQPFEVLAYYVDQSLFNLEFLTTSGTVEVSRILADHFSIPPNKLDFSEESLGEIDRQIDRQAVDTDFVRENLVLLSVYLGETYLKSFGGSWEVRTLAEFKRPIPIIITKDQLSKNLFRMVYNALTAKYGDIVLPSGVFRVLKASPFTPSA